MNILSIGNSFSQDAQRYLHRIAKSAGVEMNTFNLCIGGCPLEHHYNHMLSGEEAYWLEMNGESVGFRVSLKEALLNRRWDIITVQQVSHLANNYDSFNPFMAELVAYIRKLCPKSKIALHQTWAYEKGSERLAQLGYDDYRKMFWDIKRIGFYAYYDCNLNMVIPSGEVFYYLLDAGIEKVHRDTFHASLGLGRYALGLTWYAMLTGNDIDEINFTDWDEPIGEEEFKKIHPVVKRICKSYRTFNKTRKFACAACGWMYDRDTGAPHMDIAPGTKFEDLPDEFACPQCGTPKIAFAEKDVK